MANLFKNRFTRHPFIHVIMVLSSVIGLVFAASDLYSRESLDGEIEKALRKTVPCERIEIKTKTGEDKSGKLKSLFIKFVSMPKNILPADYVTMQYTDPQIDLKALRNSKVFTVTSYSDFKIGMLVSEQTIKNEFEKTAKTFNFHYDKFLIKFSPPFIEVEFDIPVSTIPLKDRKLIEKFIVDNRIKGYAALRLEAHDNAIFVIPAKVILNHFLTPMPVLAEIQKRINPVYQIARIRSFEYSLGKVELLKQYILISN
jgi:hypothetical protein